MNKKDIGLIFVILFLSGIISLFVSFKGFGEQVVIWQNGEMYGCYEIKNDTTIRVESALGYNEIVIDAGKVFVKEADCPDQYCVKQKEITAEGGSLICLPHKMIVELKKQK